MHTYMYMCVSVDIIIDAAECLQYAFAIVTAYRDWILVFSLNLYKYHLFPLCLFIYLFFLTHNGKFFKGIQSR